MQSRPLRAEKLGLTTSYGSQVFSPNYDMDAYMATCFGGEAWDLCYELGRAKSYCCPVIFLHKIINIQL